MPGRTNRTSFIQAFVDLKPPEQILILCGGLWYDVSEGTLLEAVRLNKIRTPASEFLAVLDSGIVTTFGASQLIDQINQSYPLDQNNVPALYDIYLTLSSAEKDSIANDQSILDLLAEVAALL